MQDLDEQLVVANRSILSKGGHGIFANTVCRISSVTSRGLTIVAVNSREFIRNVPASYVDLVSVTLRKVEDAGHEGLAAPINDAACVALSSNGIDLVSWCRTWNGSRWFLTDKGKLELLKLREKRTQ